MNCLELFSNPVISGFIGVIVGGGITCLIERRKIKFYEKATVLSIVEELKVLKEYFEPEFDELYKKNNKFIDIVYTITQDYNTIYTQNAGEIGLIKDAVFRNLIIKSNFLLRIYIENLQLYKTINQNYHRNLYKNSEEDYVNYMNFYSNKLKNNYIQLKNTINETIEKSKNIYGE